MGAQEIRALFDKNADVIMKRIFEKNESPRAAEVVANVAMVFSRFFGVRGYRTVFSADVGQIPSDHELNLDFSAATTKFGYTFNRSDDFHLVFSSRSSKVYCVINVFGYRKSDNVKK